MKMSALLAAAAYDTAFHIDPLDRFMVLDDIPADMDVRYGIYMLSRGLEPSRDASIELAGKESWIDYIVRLHGMVETAEKAGCGVISGKIADEILFDAFCLTHVQWMRSDLEKDAA